MKHLLKDVIRIDTAIGNLNSSITDINLSITSPTGAVASQLSQLRASMNNTELAAITQEIEEVRVNADGSASALAGIRTSIGVSPGTPEEQQSEAELILSTIKNQSGEAYSRAYIGVTSYSEGEAISTGLVVDGATRSLNLQGDAISFSTTAGTKKIYYDAVDDTWVVLAKVVLSDGKEINTVADIAAEDGISYQVVATPNVLKRQPNGNYDFAAIVITNRKITVGGPIDYPCKFRITALYAAGESVVYLSTMAEHTKILTVPVGVLSLKIESLDTVTMGCARSSDYCGIGRCCKFLMLKLLLQIGTIFRPGQGKMTTLKARVYRNGEDITDISTGFQI